MPNTRSKQGSLTAVAGRTTTGRDFVNLPGGVPCLTVLFINITGGTASVDIEISDDPDHLVYFPVKTVTEKTVVKVSMPCSIVAANVTAISGATVDIRYRIVELDNAPDYAIDTFQQGDIVARTLNIQGVGSLVTADAGTRKKLAQVQVANSIAAIYTVPASTRAEIVHMSVANPTGSSRTIKLCHDGTADSNIILPVTTILAGGFATFDGLIYMEAGDTLQAVCDAATALTITVYGKEYT